MSNILGELKRRNVFKVATIYVVVSWLVLQVATAVFPIFDIPVWASRLSVILLGLGFPIAVVMAWTFDLTPDGIQRQGDAGNPHVHTNTWDWVLAVLLVVAIGLMVGSQINSWERDTDVELVQDRAIVPVLSPESEVLIVAKATSSSAAYDFYLRGRDYLRQPTENSSLASATKLFDRAIGLDPRFAEAHAGLCETHLRRYEFTRGSEFFERAEVSCHRALTLNGKLWEVRVALGNLYYINGQNDRAVVELEAAVEQQPNAVNAYLVLAGVYAAQDRIDEAESTFEKAEEVESGYWGVHRLFGHFYYDQSRYADAIERYKKVAELAPDNSSGFDNLGNTYLAIGELELAEEALDAVVTPSHFTHTNRGVVYYYQGKFSQAAAEQLMAIELAPDHYRAWGSLADSYRFIDGNEKLALSKYSTAIKLAEDELLINPSNWDSVARLGMYYAHTGRPDDARKQVASLFTLTSDSTAFYFASITMSLLGDQDKAFEHLAEALERGFSKALVKNAPDLEPLRADNEFNAWLGLR